jgi:hypothetical protein
MPLLAVRNSKQVVLFVIMTVIVVTAGIGCYSILHCETIAHYAVTELQSLTPWKCVGGCGAGGSGGTAADIKWIGTGVSGGLIDAEFMSSITAGENFEYKQLKSRFSYKPTYTTNFGLTIPIVSKLGSLQPQTNNDDKTEATAGMADIMVDFSKNIGMEGEYSLSLNLTLPTGQYDVKRGNENSMLYLPATLQRGGGIYSASLGLSRTIDVEKGLWIWEAFYSHPFAVNFYGKNQFVNTKSDQYGDIYRRWDIMTTSEKKRFKYYFKPYGENDLGGYTPPAITAAVYYGSRKQQGYVHSFGAKASVPFAVAWVPDYSASTYDPKPDPNFKAWTLTLHYGLEFSNEHYPFYIAVNKTICDKSTPNANNAYDTKTLAKWDWPEWKDVLNNNWTLAVGIKSTMF